jgi:hypothetical protein
MNIMSEFEDLMNAPEIVAHHEAAHAVVFAARGVAFRHVTLRPRDPLMEACVTPYSSTRTSVVDDVLINHAGPMAETMWMYRTWGIDVDTRLGGGLHDYAEIARLCEEFPELEERYGHYELQAYHLVDRHWPLIGELATRLLTEGTVSGPEVRRMFWCEADRRRAGR